MAITGTSTSEKTIGRAPAGRKRGEFAGSRGPNGLRGPNGRGGGGGGGRDDNWRREPTPDRYRLGMWVALASILMMFTALTSAYIVRMGGANEARTFDVPPFLWASTVLILASSFSIERARKSLRRGDVQASRRMLFVTLLLGLGFVAGQLLAWRQLVGAGFYLKSNPHSSFFYVLTGMHGLHVLGGILGLNYLLLRTSNPASERDVKARRLRAVDAVTLYWHFMDGLWIYLFLLLFLWR